VLEKPIFKIAAEEQRQREVVMNRGVGGIELDSIFKLGDCFTEAPGVLIGAGEIVAGIGEPWRERDCGLVRGDCCFELVIRLERIAERVVNARIVRRGLGQLAEKLDRSFGPS
jgi:hypothetical protein